MAEKLQKYKVQPIEQMIFTIRGQKVILDVDLGHIYGVSIRDLRSQFATSSYGSIRSQFATASHGGRRYRPYTSSSSTLLQIELAFMISIISKLSA
jgi:hypothetical protein